MWQMPEFGFLDKFDNDGNFEKDGIASSIHGISHPSLHRQRLDSSRGTSKNYLTDMAVKYS